MSVARNLFYAGRTCQPYLRWFLLQQLRMRSRGYGSLAAASASNILSGRRYFWDNNIWPVELQARLRVRQSNEEDSGSAHSLESTAPASSHLPPAGRIEGAVLPHRRRKKRQSLNATGSDTTLQEKAIPLDASSQLSTLSSKAPSNTLRRTALAYLSLSKPRLTFLIVLTTTASYSLFPVAVSPMSSSMNLSPFTLLTLTTGTALASASANAFNMLFEPKYDAKMTRTRSRPLVRGLMTTRAALAFAICTGVTGVALLNYGVNPTTACLGAANILLYAGIYTPLKRLSVWNTWAGALVGGIPPLMGWTAAAGQATPYADATWRDLLFASDGSSAGGWLLAALLFAWQFPHFWALAYPIRSEYAAAGYRMLVSYDVRKTARISLRYSVLMFPICAALSYSDVTSWAFVPASGVVNAWLVRESWRYLQHEGAKGSARSLFWASVWHLPVVLVLAMIMKKGLWERFIQGGLDDAELRAWQLVEQDHVDNNVQEDTSTSETMGSE